MPKSRKQGEQGTRVGVTSPCDPETESSGRGGEHAPFSEKATEPSSSESHRWVDGKPPLQAQSEKGRRAEGVISASARAHFVSCTLKNARTSRRICPNLFCTVAMGIAPEWLFW